MNTRRKISKSVEKGSFKGESKTDTPFNVKQTCICGKEYRGINIGCSEECAKDIDAIIKVVIVAGEVMKIIKKVKLKVNKNDRT